MAVVGALNSPAAGQTYPDRPIRVLSTTPTAGVGDVVVRLIAEHASRTLKQSVVVEVQSAATGQIATQAIVRGEPDGYSLLWGNSNLVNTQAVKKGLPFDVIHDLAPISLAVSSPLLLVVNSSLPIGNLDDFVRYARAKPGELAFGSVGVGSGIHLTGESLGRALGARLTHVPYANSGMATQLTDLTENRIQVILATWSTVQAVVTSGKAKVIAVLAKDHYPMMPELPPVTDALPNFVEVPVWFGMLAPAGTPEPIVDLWYREIRAALAESDIKLRLESLGLVVVASDPAYMAQTIKTGISNISVLAKELDIEIPQ
jgi:tripartite-type tricarboxylate transporter receptor subunit TctC